MRKRTNSDSSNTSKIEHLTTLENQSSATLKLFDADLLNKGSFEEAMGGCELVFHTASPFMISDIKNPETELIRPAKEGTRNVLESANKNHTVKRIVLTSSVVAIYGDNADIKKTPNAIGSIKKLIFFIFLFNLC